MDAHVRELQREVRRGAPGARARLERELARLGGEAVRIVAPAPRTGPAVTAPPVLSDTNPARGDVWRGADRRTTAWRRGMRGQPHRRARKRVREVLRGGGRHVDDWWDA